MTADKSFKRLVRQRMRETGLSYAAARHVLRQQKRRPHPMATRDELYEAMAAMQTTIRDFLAPVAEEHNKPLDPALVSALMFDREGTHEGGPRRWVVHLYTLSPGLVIGRRGAVADELRGQLCGVSGDRNLRLNIIDFGKIHAGRQGWPTDAE